MTQSKAPNINVALIVYRNLQIFFYTLETRIFQLTELQTGFKQFLYSEVEFKHAKKVTKKMQQTDPLMSNQLAMNLIGKAEALVW